ncbi:hypothetical protein GCM10010145_51230 [Streptomyces ruber]|uniref:Uncharacterized protein n=2 Tax=Streptomyces TaxID=1883 RepID=A0A918BKF5_9ACTN|nr:hypothetical protein [Streptomyces ruber]GGQ75393.1 hypothetical protein GCM10010145_51230 [Streptomyces ruber]
MPTDLSFLIAATTRWLTRAYPTGGGVLASALCEAQVRQAVTVAAWLRYPTSMDAALVAVAGPGGSARLDWITGSDGPAHGGTGGGDREADSAWRTWVDEVVASWAASLLGAPALAAAAVTALGTTEHLDGLAVEFRRLVAPDEHDRRAAVLLRHPDLLAPVAELHRAQLLSVLATPSAAESPDDFPEAC